MVVKRWDPTGSDGSDVAVSGSLLSSVIKAGAGTFKYEADAGFFRGGEIGAELYAGTADTDQANGIMNANAAAAAGSVQAYFKILTPPTAGTLTGVVPFLDIRGSGGNLIRAAINPSLQLTCQNAAGSPPGGSLNGTLATLLTTKVYRIELDAVPATSTTGSGALRLYEANMDRTALGYDDADTLLFSGSVSGAGNFGTTQPSAVRFGDSATTANGPYGFRIQMTQIAIDTGASVPTIAPVTQNAPPPDPDTGLYPAVMVSGAWVGVPSA